MTWPPCLSERFITPCLKSAFGSLPRRADLDTVITFLADQFVGDFDGMGAEFERLARMSEESGHAGEDIREDVPIVTGDVDTPFRLRVLYLLHRGKVAKEMVVRKGKPTKAKMEECREQRPPSITCARGSIRSSTFATVMRLVAGIGPARSRTPTGKLPAPACAPPVWAQSRQELCEALPYYRAFQSGMYMHKRVPFGYLLDGFPSPRDVWADDGKVIISHGYTHSGAQC
ncbi:hypothetical protein CspeluHIS016_0304880 [Cutaneotrichosporon spelunceum]|uniref:Uncharacterized protein n=1 Tax=Cutaneotrichosporon spelunceum TaxID=1672016 RepID=A0AAD3YC11_9TREE|nr:hypothetical protein CspeluHIS016_0304880 [Cutaneotrichosporon spelunceum]